MFILSFARESQTLAKWNYHLLESAIYIIIVGINPDACNVRM